MRRLIFVFVALAAVAGFYDAPAQTQVYSYDVHGRLNATGTSTIESTTYSFDPADNRRGVVCCDAVGPVIIADGFDPYFYVLAYPDILAAGVDPYQHWLSNGSSEGRNPNRFFNAAYYRATYDIPIWVNALADYNATGWRAGHNPSPEFSTNLYLQAHPDVAAANINPLLHYLGYGYLEGRAIFPSQ